ncbi:MAG: fumarate reductase/succinate dehydrogenase flavoprotein subunit [Verrucomicrobia bacterium]|nr:MAG: fumarate reductase/succinate dehydrogenase flavoprotein subunit [Verrucomicrobiota bacterium]
MPDYETFEHDVLIIGAGGAGLRAAIEASAAGVRVGLVCKSLLGKAHTVMAEGGIAAALANVDERDNWKVHFADTMRGGQYVNQWRMAELHAKEAPDRVRELEAWGAVFDRTKDGRILQRHFGGHKYPRLAHVGDRTGLEMIRTLQDHGVHQGIDVHMEHTVLSLLKDGSRVVGAFGYERERGRFKIFGAKAVVLATGGIGRAYKITSNSWEYTGDGHALAYEAGAELIDMEFVQFHPTGMVWPPSVMGILVTEGVRGEGGILPALANVDERDNWKVHFADTMRGGQYVNQWRMAELHAKEAPDRVRELEAWGAVFDRTKDGRILQRHFGGHKYPRLAHVGDRTGLEMIRTLQDHGVHQGIDVHMEHTVLSLLKDGSRVVGAFGYERERGRFKIFGAKAVVLATGGIGRAYKITSNSWEYTGDGHALAYEAGAELIDMEFVQFHPTGMVWPPSVMGILVTEGVRGEGGILLNKDGKRFMFEAIPENYRAHTADDEEEGWRYCQGHKDARRPPELLTRDHVSRCIVREIKEGRGSPHGGVYLDISWIKQKMPNAAEHIKRKLPSMYHQFKQLADIDITEQPMEVGPTTHYIMGGVRVDPDTQMTRLPGLFAAGECAAGINGANRLGGNSLSDLLVFGKRAGEYAAKFARENQHGQINTNEIDAAAREALASFERSNGENPYAIQKDLQETMQNLVGIVRTETEMREALEKIGNFKTRAKKAAVTGNREYNPGWHTALDLKNLLTISEAITRAALDRKESRGAQFREDYPDKEERFSKVNTIMSKAADGSMQVRLEPLPEMPDDLKQIIEENR